MNTAARIFLDVTVCAIYISTAGAMERHDKIYVAGHRGLVGRAVVHELETQGYDNIVSRTKEELDLCNRSAVVKFFEDERPQQVFLAAAKVGSIEANRTNPVGFLYDNLSIATNVIACALRAGAKRLLFLGSACVYPRNCPQPIKEEYMGSRGPLEEFNDAYALAKITATKMCQLCRRQRPDARFIACMPTNLYGDHDNFHPINGHLVPGLISRIYAAHEKGDPTVIVWGTGTPRREFLHADDCAKACVYLMQHYDGNEIVNVGSGTDVTVREVAEMIAKIIGYKGELVFDKSKPDGAPRRLLDVSKINALGWKADIDLEEGLRRTVDWYIAHKDEVVCR